MEGNSFRDSNLLFIADSFSKARVTPLIWFTAQLQLLEKVNWKAEVETEKSLEFLKGREMNINVYLWRNHKSHWRTDFAPTCNLSR